MDLMNPEQILFEEISALIEQSKHTIYSQAKQYHCFTILENRTACKQ